MRVLAIIPARGGSKGVPRKNLKLLGNKPLIAYTIETALNCKAVTDLITTSDDDEILQVAESYGSMIIKRPVELAMDETKMPPVVSHVIETMRKQSVEYDTIILLQPTCPFRLTEDIDVALDMLEKGNVDSVISVCEVGDSHPARMYQINEGGLKAFMPEWEKENRQNLPNLYHRNGVIYALKRALFEEKQTFFINNSKPLVIPKERAINIDEALDFTIAELLVKNFQ
ncbi:cytidylyltransferase domain-containing protein [Alkalimarinus coralli]|uniref:acylneuraminate cytidylyltransferase family protein n=1 Tax=Alkalimarinus coralli TaxID=2935863 RepID=UPI00202AFC66|nr:acylneuraminate cytidylyltransferase family protein [Alkalimarinus coralli]